MSTLSTKSVEALQTELASTREAFRSFRYASAGSRTKNVREGRELRRQIARILTEIQARTIADKKKTA